jgi:hypothetical protein
MVIFQDYILFTTTLMLSPSLLCMVIMFGSLTSGAIELSRYFFKVHRISGIIHTEDQMISYVSTLNSLQ